MTWSTSPLWIILAISAIGGGILLWNHIQKTRVLIASVLEETRKLIELTEETQKHIDRTDSQTAVTLTDISKDIKLTTQKLFDLIERLVNGRISEDIKKNK